MMAYYAAGDRVDVYFADQHGTMPMEIVDMDTTGVVLKDNEFSGTTFYPWCRIAAMKAIK